MQFDRFVARTDICPSGLQRPAIKIAADQRLIALKMSALDQNCSRAAKRIEDHVFRMRSRQDAHRGGDRRPQRSGDMRGLVFTEAHRFVAQSDRKKEFVLDETRPELDVGFVLNESPGATTEKISSALRSTRSGSASGASKKHIPARPGMTRRAISWTPGAMT